MIVKNEKESTHKKNLELKCDYTKVTKYKFNIQKWTTFSIPIIKNLEIEIKNKMPFALTPPHTWNSYVQI